MPETWKDSADVMMMTTTATYYYALVGHSSAAFLPAFYFMHCAVKHRVLYVVDGQTDKYL